VTLTFAQLSDIHFGRDVRLDQVAAFEAAVPAMRPDAIILAGDLTQRARHGELQMARALYDRLGKVAPTVIIPGNHDVQWWASPFHLRGSSVLYTKYRQYFGKDLTPTLERDGFVIAGALSSYGVAAGSMTWNLNDMAVKGHLPKSETDRLREYFEAQPAEAVRVVVLHHNVLRGAISQRMGLAHWRDAQLRLKATGADLVLCGHDHQEGSGQIDNTVVVSTSSSLTPRTRGRRPAAFNIVRVMDDAIEVQHLRWENDLHRFKPSDLARYARPRRKSRG
jgi:3',5'-cyclic AMP phosphodiesterase CpdA